MWRLDSKTATTAALFGAIVLADAVPAKAQVGCSANDQRLIRLYTHHAVQAGAAGDLGRYMALLQELNGRVSPGCQAALAHTARPSPQHSMRSARPPTVLDHGGGTYSVPGVGACGPGGCVSY